MAGWLSIIGGSAAALTALAAAVTVSARRAERRHPPLGRFVEVDGVRLRYLERGDGPPLVLLHGNGAMLDDFVASGVFELASRHFRVVAFDRPGFGYSDRPRGAPWTPERQAELLRGAFTQLGIVQPVVVGHSWGTLVTVALALRHPEAARAIVLMSGYYFPTPRLDVPLLSPPALPVIGDVMRYTVSPLLGWLLRNKIIAHLFAPLPVPVRFNTMFPVPLTLRPWQIRAAAEETALMIPAAARLSPSYDQLRVPAAILFGAADKLIDPDKQSRRLHEVLPGSRVTTVPGAGHMVHYAVPETVVETVLELVGTPEEGARRKA